MLRLSRLSSFNNTFILRAGRGSGILKELGKISSKAQALPINGRGSGQQITTAIEDAQTALTIKSQTTLTENLLVPSEELFDSGKNFAELKKSESQNLHKKQSISETVHHTTSSNNFTVSMTPPLAVTPTQAISGIQSKVSYNIESTGPKKKSNNKDVHTSAEIKPKNEEDMVVTKETLVYLSDKPDMSLDEFLKIHNDKDQLERIAVTIKRTPDESPYLVDINGDDISKINTFHVHAFSPKTGILGETLTHGNHRFAYETKQKEAANRFTKDIGKYHNYHRQAAAFRTEHNVPVGTSETLNEKAFYAYRKDQKALNELKGLTKTAMAMSPAKASLKLHDMDIITYNASLPNRHPFREKENTTTSKRPLEENTTPVNNQTNTKKNSSMKKEQEQEGGQYMGAKKFLIRIKNPSEALDVHLGGSILLQDEEVNVIYKEAALEQLETPREEQLWLSRKDPLVIEKVKINDLKKEAARKEVVGKAKTALTPALNNTENKCEIKHERGAESPLDHAGDLGLDTLLGTDDALSTTPILAVKKTVDASHNAQEEKEKNTENILSEKESVTTTAKNNNHSNNNKNNGINSNTGDVILALQSVDTPPNIAQNNFMEQQMDAGSSNPLSNPTLYKPGALTDLTANTGNQKALPGNSTEAKTLKDTPPPPGEGE